MRNQNSATQPDFIAIMYHPVYLRRWISHRWVSEIFSSSGLDDRHICVHYHVLCVGLALYLGTARVVIPVGMADQQDADVSKPEAELLNTLPNQRWRCLQTGVDEDISLRSDDKIRRQILASDVIEIVRNLNGAMGVIQSGRS
jgi:hypothetical protein